MSEQLCALKKKGDDPSKVEVIEKNNLSPNSFSGYVNSITFNSGVTGKSNVAVKSIIDFNCYEGSSGRSGASFDQPTINSSGVITFTIRQYKFLGQYPPSGFSFIIW